MSRWFGENEDPFTKVGYARCIVVRHNPSYNHRGKLDNCTQIMAVSTFAIGFEAPPIDKSRYGSGPAFWLDEAVSDDCAHSINHLFKDKPNGLYELTGEIMHWSSQSYEGEWDGESELRNTKMQQISFDHAMAFNKENEGLFDEMVRLFTESNRRGTHYQEGTDIHPYMTHQQILVNQANALARLVNGTYHNRENYKDCKIEDLESNIFMLMLQVDSEKQNLQPKALEIDIAVKECIQNHNKWMNPDYA